jgi:hypothetical protein
MDSNGVRYLDLIKNVLTNVIYEDAPYQLDHVPALFRFTGYDSAGRREGLDWPTVAHTMVGLKRLENLHDCMDQVVADDVAGDFIETGVWRGGACIFMRAYLAAQSITNRRVWVADSFQGMPDTETSQHHLDRDLPLHHLNNILSISMDTVQDNFRRYGLLDDQVHFLPGWFRNTLPTAPVDKLAIIRLDGTLYESTMDALGNLYPKLSPGGFVIVNDYVLPACQQAVHDHRKEFNILDPIQTIDTCGVYWRRNT